MADSTLDTLCKLRDAGYFGNPDFAALQDMAREFGLEAALFTPISSRAVLLDAEDLADGGAGMAIQQVRMLLAARGTIIEAADSEEYDEASGATLLEVDGTNCVLMDWSFARRALPDDLAQLDCDTALRDLLWKSRVQGYELAPRPCEHGADGVDLHLASAQGLRSLAHWSQGFDDGRVLYSVNFFTIVNRLLAQLGLSERLYAWQAFTSGQTGVLLDPAWHATLFQMKLTTQLRRIDAAQ
ncbi:MAG: hypothetical protein JO002_01110 [Burkholderiaceae bacterium]|nr:hypothetical protein [Burkholderiaceae bacterium]